MDKADPRIELRISRQAFFQPRHPDQYQSNFPGIEGRAHLLQACHPQAVRFIDHDEGGRVSDPPFLFRVILCELTVGRLELWNWPGEPVVRMRGPLRVFFIFEKVECPRPVFIGDTVYAESEVVDLPESKSRPQWEIAMFEHRGKNQRGELVVRARRAAIMRRKPA